MGPDDAALRVQGALLLSTLFAKTMHENAIQSVDFPSEMDFVETYR